jgi:hypothetical protein
MPPRYAYWTIIVDEQPTAFRAAQQEDLMPTFKRLKEKQPTAKMMWFQNGKLWPSRLDAQEAMRARGEMGRRGDSKQGGFRDRKPARERNVGENFSSPGPDRKPRRDPDEKLEWKPKGEFEPAPKRSDRPEWRPKDQKSEAFGRGPRRSEQREGGSRSEWKPKGAAADRRPRSFARPEWKPSADGSAKPEWKPKGSFTRERKPDWKPTGSFDRERKPDWKPTGSFDRERTSARPQARWSDRKPASPRARKPGESLEWKPKGEFTPAPKRSDRAEWTPKSQAPGPKSPEKRKWVPKEEYKKSLGIEAKRDSKWRPGGEHRDPKQKYKDAKKAKWTRFKQTVRKRWESKDKKKS